MTLEKSSSLQHYTNQETQNQQPYAQFADSALQTSLENLITED